MKLLHTPLLLRDAFLITIVEGVLARILMYFNDSAAEGQWGPQPLEKGRREMWGGGGKVLYRIKARLEEEVFCGLKITQYNASNFIFSYLL